ncbi:MAG: polyprenyl synthetase family protein [Bacteroidia bacterium]|nr:polyprenyl synthetase family protein [Bacteroidia bacterium]
MALTLTDIQAPIADELTHFHKYFRSAMKSRVMLLDKIMQYLVKRKGKEMRPMFVLLSANLCGGITAPTYRGAALVELLHTATLVHDDVVDDSEERRGFFSINALWKNKIAVLVGDFLLSRGLLMSLEHDDFQLLKIVSNAVKLMSEGELLQIEKARKLNIDEPVYFEIIRQKTASLIASCTECGAASATDDKAVIEKMRLFGEKVGIAFQIRDDLFDYGTQDVGKPLGIDIKEKKMTLPLIHTLNKSSWGERRKVINIIRNHNTDKKKVDWVIDFVKRNGGIEYSENVMQEYIREAKAILSEFPESESRKSMFDLIEYTVARQK